MRFVIDQDRDLVFSTEAIETLQCFRFGAGNEAGGILLGRVYAHAVEVEIATAPTKADRSGRYFFHRDRRTAQARVDREWQATSGERIYLGEWHSHPEGRARPRDAIRA
jgi:integrative and conjugative element protein (TIGR02256 family)